MTEKQNQLDVAYYSNWIEQIKAQIKHAQIKASIAVNQEMLALYWEIGKDIYEQHLDTAYGKHFFEKLSRDLREAFPGIQGFSERNLRYMRAFYAFYHIPILHQPGAELESMLFVIPWRQHVEIFSRAKSFDEAMFFIEKTKQNGWSRAMLINMMDTQIYHNKSGSINNFSITLPSEDSSQANEIIRDQYKLDFLTLHENYKEAELQKSLEQNLTRFLLTLGTGFAYVGRQIPLIVNGDEYFCDMLFYHLKLRRYIVVELKIVKFEPEFVSKLNFYCTAVNHLMKQDFDKNTIGLLICKEKNDLVAQWSVENCNEPIGIATYSLTNIVPLSDNLLPSAKIIENALNLDSDKT